MPSFPPTRTLPPLPRSFFVRDPREVARGLLGKLLVRRDAHTFIAGRIVETEAYCGVTDPGSHAFCGLTPRNEVLFGPPGHAYIYFIYGNHFCTNVSCQQPGDAGGVLLRALEPVCGLETMAALRGITLPTESARQPSTSNSSKLRLLTSGPGRLSQALSITREHDNAKDLCSPSSDLYIVDDGSPVSHISATTRINVTHAPHDEWRYIVTGNPYVSGPRSHRPTVQQP